VFISVKLTSSRKPPSVRQKTSGPAMSVSWRICWSVPRSGFSTASVWNRREGERERESNTIKIRASEGLHNDRRGLGVCVGWSLSGNRPSSLMEFAAGHGIRNTGLWTRDTGHYTTQFICSHSGHKTKPNSRFPNICSLCVLVLPLVFAPCAVAEKFEKWKLMINDIADQPAIQPATKWAGAWKLGQKLSTHLTHANVGQGQEPWNLIL